MTLPLTAEPTPGERLTSTVDLAEFYDLSKSGSYTLRYDVDLGSGVTFKADDRDAWHHEAREMGGEIELSFPIGATLAIPP